MKFGPSPFTYDLVMDILSKKGIEALSRFSIVNNVEQALNKGFQHVELGLDVFQTFSIPLKEEDLLRLHHLKHQKAISYSCHLPYYSLDLAGPNQFIREGSQKALVGSYQSNKILEKDIDCFVIHPIGENTVEILDYIGQSQTKSIVLDLFKLNAVQSIKRFIEATGIDPKKIAIENLEFPLIHTLEIIRETGTRFCLDTAHLLGGLSGSLDLCNVLIDYYNLITEIHLQDYNNQNLMSDHAALGTSGLFPPDFMDILLSKNFTGPVVFELSYEEIEQSYRYLHKLHPHQFRLPLF